MELRGSIRGKYPADTRWELHYPKLVTFYSLFGRGRWVEGNEGEGGWEELLETEVQSFRELGKIAQMFQDISGNQRIKAVDSTTGEEIFLLYRR